jgi:tyrosine-protein phosphatase YwqE
MNEVITIKSETLAISRDLRKLYDDFKDKRISRETAETLANIAGKNLRAQAILLVESEIGKQPTLIESADE